MGTESCTINGFHIVTCAVQPRLRFFFVGKFQQKSWFLFVFFKIGLKLFLSSKKIIRQLDFVLESTDKWWRRTEESKRSHKRPNSRGGYFPVMSSPKVGGSTVAVFQVANIGSLTSCHFTTSWLINNWRDKGFWKSGPYFQGKTTDLTHYICTAGLRCYMESVACTQFIVFSHTTLVLTWRTRQ